MQKEEAAMTLSKRLFGGAVVTATGAAFAMGSAGFAHADVTPANTPPVDTLYSSVGSADTWNNGGDEVGRGAAELVSSAVEYIPVTAVDTVKEAVMLPTDFKNTPSSDTE
jgi:hypothetical protein